MKLSRGKFSLFTLWVASACLLWSTHALAMDHSMMIEGPFASGQEVTETCLGCHFDAGSEVMQTLHWTWQQVHDGETVSRGKATTFNNFSVAVAANEPRCTSCHAGYGWADNSFDFTDETRVDCLVCHDTTGTYVKSLAGHPAPEVDLGKVAQSVGKTSRQACGTCHFFAGEDEAFNHGDLDSSIANPRRELDVHMATDGLNFSCTDCHTAEQHNISAESQIGCSSCHGDEPHRSPVLNRHYRAMACQTCHIPEVAKEIATIIATDWSTAGQDIPVTMDKNGRPIYDKNTGHLTWSKNIEPTYRWHNGTAGAYQLGDKIDPETVTALRYPLGDRLDLSAKIYPFREHTATQIYDSNNMYLITPKLFGEEGDMEAYRQGFDWNAAAAAGMQAGGLDYSGEYAFAPTTMYWRVNHKIAPKAKALRCINCHGSSNRLNWQELGYTTDPMLDQSQARSR